MSIYILATRDEDPYDFYSSFLCVCVFYLAGGLCLCRGSLFFFPK